MSEQNDEIKPVVAHYDPTNADPDKRFHIRRTDNRDCLAHASQMQVAEWIVEALNANAERPR